MFDTIIVSGGNIDQDFALDFISETIQKTENREEKSRRDTILMIAADHGLDFFAETSLVPDCAIGDFDSVSSKGKAFMELHPEMEIVRLLPEKDDSDTHSACKLAMSKGRKSILILGATGSRLDHVISNLGLLAFGKEHEVKIVLADANNLIELVESGREIRKDEQFGKYVSFFPFGTPVEKLTLQGFKYPLHEHNLRSTDCGLTVSNEIQDDTARVEFEAGNLIMIQSIG